MTPSRRTVTEGDETKLVEFRPDALERLRARKVLDGPQYEAGVRLRVLIETAQISPLQAQEYDRVYLDHDVVLSRSVGIVPLAGDALKKLVMVEQRMGVPDFPICLAIVKEDRHLVELPRLMPTFLGRYEKRTIGPRVCEAFDNLARTL